MKITVISEATGTDMFVRIRSWFAPRVKKIAFIDGDQGFRPSLRAYEKFLKGTETHFVTTNTIPNLVSRIKEINSIRLEGYRTGKEVTDKYIAAGIQKALGAGYRDVTVISSDYDFIDIFKMAVRLNPDMSDVVFRMVVPKPKGRICTTQSTVKIQVVLV